MKKKYIVISDGFSGFSMASKKLVILLFFMFFSVLNAQGQITVAGAVSGNGTYATLGQAFTAIGTSQTGANITISVTGNTTEGTTAILGAGDWTSVTISPSGGEWTIAGNLAADVIRFNGADNVTVNGLNSGGNKLTISNASTSNMSGTCAIKFQSDASNNTITNCTLLGSATMPSSTPGGVVLFSTGTTTGNDNNTISNCKIGPAGGSLPSKLIFSSGSTTTPAHFNSGNTITGCHLYDYFLTTDCSAVYITSGNTGWTITNNKIFQTAPRTFTASGTMYGVYFANMFNSTNIQITGNTIGYANDSGSGTLSLTANAFNGAFTGIYFFASNNAPDLCNLNNNTISNVSLTSVGGSMYGIHNATQSGTNSINLNGNVVRNLEAITTTGALVGIYAGGAESLDCSNNTINNLSRDSAGAFYGIQYSSPASVTFQSNTITNLNSIAADNGGNILAGIFSNNGPQTEQFFNNTITGLTSASTTGGINIFGINNGSSPMGNKTFVMNSIGDFSLPAFGTGTISGIRLNGGGTLNTFLGNTVYTLTGGNAVNGIVINAGTTSNVSKNKIYGLNSPAAGAVVKGMALTGGTTHNVFNNIIGDLTTPAANTANSINGIYISGGTSVNAYYNTVRLNASSTGALFGSSAVYATTGPIVDFRNNIFVNESTVAGGGLAAAYRRSSTDLTTYAPTSNNNLFYGSTIFTDGTNTDTTLSAYQARVGARDASSVSVLPPFVGATGSNAQFLHIDTAVATPIEGGGAPIAGYTTDFDNDVRNATTPDIGADEFTTVLGVNDSVFSSLMVYPNPVSDVLQIANSQFITKLEVYSITGQKMLSKDVNSMMVAIPMSGMAAGTYFVKVFADEAVKTIKVLKE